MAMIRHTHRAGTGLTPEQLAMVEAAAKRPYTYDPDCPLLTEKQLAQFRPINGMTWEERAEAMRRAGVFVDEDEEEYLEPAETENLVLALGK